MINESTESFNQQRSGIFANLQDTSVLRMYAVAPEKTDGRRVVTAVIEHLVSSISSRVLRVPPSDGLTFYVSRVGEALGVDWLVFMVASIYIQRLLAKYPKVRFEEPQRPLFTAVILGCKYTCDAVHSNLAWARALHLSLRDVNRCEREFLSLLQYDLYIDPCAFAQMCLDLHIPPSPLQLPLIQSCSPPRFDDEGNECSHENGVTCSTTPLLSTSNNDKSSPPHSTMDTTVRRRGLLSHASTALRRARQTLVRFCRKIF